jgi:hypothetical protein
MGKASRKKQGQYAGVDGEGRPLFPSTSNAAPQVAGVPLTWLLLVVAAAFWAGAHLPGDYSFISAIAYLATGILLGVLNPGLGAAMAIALVPFYGGNSSQGLGELVRSAPILGAAGRLLYNRVAHRGDGATPWTPDARLVGAAVIAVLLYPLTRVTANGSEWATADRLFDDVLFLIGAPVAMYATWIVASHLPRAAVDRLLQMLPFALGVALLFSLAAWIGIPVAEPFTFYGAAYGRLAALGYPTPTGMGIAISLPLAVGALWSRSRRAAIVLAIVAIVTIILTESRGPIFALVVAVGVMAIISSGIPRKFILGGAALAVAVVSALLIVRYPDLIRKLQHGRLPSLRGDELRITSWFAGIQIALQHPITGGGWMSVRGWNGGELGDKNVNLSHNIILQGLADGGFLLGGAITTVIVSSVRGAWSRRHSIPVYWIGAAITVLVCGLWDMPHLRAYGAVVSGLALGLVSRGSESEINAE